MGMKEQLLKVLAEVQKKYPQRKWRALMIKDNDFTFSVTTRRAAKALSIDGSNYQGIVYLDIKHNSTRGLNPNALTVALIVDEKEFIYSGNLALILIKKYEIHN
ncbi:hypothetical protein [Lactobacillus gasseri]|uniref:hypothetical protein n=1 Tax=Lactobacillus gasseri TaxID=1596 RepID=UPI0040444F73